MITTYENPHTIIIICRVIRRSYIKVLIITYVRYGYMKGTSTSYEHTCTVTVSTCRYKILVQFVICWDVEIEITRFFVWSINNLITIEIYIRNFTLTGCPEEIDDSCVCTSSESPVMIINKIDSKSIKFTTDPATAASNIDIQSCRSVLLYHH